MKRTGYAFTRPSVARRSHPECQGVKGKCSQHSGTANVLRTHPNPKANPCRLGPALGRKSNANVGSAMPKFTHLKSGKQPSFARGQACGSSVDSPIISMTYMSIVLALSCGSAPGSQHNGQWPICPSFAPRSGRDLHLAAGAAAALFLSIIQSGGRESFAPRKVPRFRISIRKGWSLRPSLRPRRHRVSWSASLHAAWPRPRLRRVHAVDTRMGLRH